MVNITFIKTNQCPVCGCKNISLESIESDNDRAEFRRHANGATWETREFACGYRVMYVPNYRHEEVITHCHFDPEIAKEKERKKKAKETILQQIDAAECDDKYKERLRAAIQYV